MNQVITMIDLEITPPLQRETVRSYVYRMLYDNIMSLHLPPGSAMSEQEVADLLKTSRTPVREAFIHLGQDHLLDILPQRGTFVARLHTQMIREARFMRVVMEEAVMAEACQGLPESCLRQLYEILERQQKAADAGDKRAFFEADNAFHETVFSGCGRPHIWQTLMRASLDYSRARVLNAFLEPKEIPLSVHEDMLKAIESHEGDKAARLVRQHMANQETGIRKLMQLYPNYFI